MFRILQDSLFNPKGLITQTKRSWFFVIIYIFVLALFMSLGTGSDYIAYESSVVNYETTGCSLVDNQVLCDDANNPTLTEVFDIYGSRIYILNPDQTVDDIVQMNTNAFVLQGDMFAFYSNGEGVIGYKLFTDETNFQTLEEGYNYTVNVFLFSSLTLVFISNIVLITIFILLATLMFSRFKKFMKYGDRFKLAVFGATPIALVITFYNIIDFSFIIFFILSIFAYRTLTNMSRHLYFDFVQKNMQDQYGEYFYEQFNKDDVVDSYDPDEIYDESDEE